MAEDPNLQKTDTPIQVAKPETVQSQAPAAASQLEVKKTETPEMKQVENKEVKLETKTEEVKSEVTSETKVEEVKIEEPKKEEIKAEETKAVESKKEEVKVEEVKAEEPKKEAKVEVKKTEKVELKNEVDQAVSELVEEIHEIATEFKQINTTPLKVEQPVVPSNPVNAVSTNAPVVTAGEQVKTEVPTPKPAETTPVVATAPVAPTPEVKPADADNVVASPEEQAIIDNLMKEVGNIQPAATQPVKTSLFAKIFAKFKKEKMEDAAVKVEGNQDQAKQKKLPKGLKIALLVLGIILVITLILGGLAFFTVKPIISKAQKTATLGQEAYTLIKQQNLTEGKAKLLEAKNSLTDTQNAYNKTAWMKFIPVISKYREDGEDGLKAGMAGIEAGEILLDAVIPYADVLGLTGEGTFMGGTVEDRVVKMVETLEKIVPQLDAVTAKLSVANEELKKIDPNDYPEQIKGKEVRARILQAESLVSDATLALTDAKPIIEVLPELLGYPNFKQYLVIFQNDGEQRPTGGFMSAFAVLKADKGKITAEKSGDIYSLDDKFGRNVAAPEIIQKYLDEKSWHLRNMNLSPDFRVSMTTFKDAYDGLQGETEVSGVIAINTHVLEELIKVIGPVTVEGYGTFTTELDARCNLSQVICELEHMIDKPLATMVSNRKSTVLGPLMQQIMKQAMGGGKEQMASLFTLAMDLVKQKHVLAYFDDEKEQKANEIFNMAGRIKDFDGDYLHINNANFGGAKSNFYITQEVEQEIQIAADGTVTKKLYISYSHNQPMDNCNLEDGDLCLSGIQRNYFRVYVPKGSVLTEGLGSEVEIDTGEDLGKTYFDGFFELRPESKAKVMLVYTLPFKVSNGQAYKMMIQKQAGEKEISYKVNLNGKEENFIVNEDLEKSWQVN